MKIKIKWTEKVGVVELIRTIRVLAGIGLKEAKDLVWAKMAVPNYSSLIHAGSVIIDAKSIDDIKNTIKISSKEISIKILGGKRIQSKTGFQKGNHMFEFPNNSAYQLIIEKMRESLNTSRFHMRVQDHGTWLGVKIHKAKN